MSGYSKVGESEAPSLAEGGSACVECNPTAPPMGRPPRGTALRHRRNDKVTREHLRQWAEREGLTVWVGARHRGWHGSPIVDAIRLRWRPREGTRSRAILFEAEDGKIRFTDSDRLAIARCIAEIAGIEPPEVQG